MPARDNKTTHRSLYPCEGCCTNYRVAVGHLRTDTIQLLYLNMTISCLYCANYRVAVGLLVGQGWERKLPTLSKWCIKPHKAVGLGPFPID